MKKLRELKINGHIYFFDGVYFEDSFGKPCIKAAIYDYKHSIGIATWYGNEAFWAGINGIDTEPNLDLIDWANPDEYRLALF